MADSMMYRNLGLRACKYHTFFIKMLTTVLKVPEGGRKGVETPGLPEGNLSYHTNFGGPIALPQMYVRTCQSQKMKA